MSKNNNVFGNGDYPSGYGSGVTPEARMKGLAFVDRLRMSTGQNNTHEAFHGVDKIFALNFEIVDSLNERKNASAAHTLQPRAMNRIQALNVQTLKNIFADLGKKSGDAFNRWALGAAIALELDWENQSPVGAVVAFLNDANARENEARRLDDECAAGGGMRSELARVMLPAELREALESAISGISTYNP